MKFSIELSGRGFPPEQVNDYASIERWAIKEERDITSSFCGQVIINIAAHATIQITQYLWQWLVNSGGNTEIKTLEIDGENVNPISKQNLEKIVERLCKQVDKNSKMPY